MRMARARVTQGSVECVQQPPLWDLLCQRGSLSYRSLVVSIQENIQRFAKRFHQECDCSHIPDEAVLRNIEYFLVS